MTSPAKLNEYNHAEEPARLLLERLGWTYAPREALAAERDVLQSLKAAIADALLTGRVRVGKQPGTSPITPWWRLSAGRRAW